MSSHLKKLSVCCCTYDRPDMLGELIQSYLMQTYPATYRELIILDDAGQYGNVYGDGWQIVSFPRRFASLGEKRNACAMMASPDSEYIVVADDDDIYLPHWLESHADNFARGAEWSFAATVCLSYANNIDRIWTYPDRGWLVHPSSAFSKRLFWQVGGYPNLAWKEDGILFKKMKNAVGEPIDALNRIKLPFLIFRRRTNPGHQHTTRMSLQSYRDRDIRNKSYNGIEIRWKRNYFRDVVNSYTTWKTSFPQSTAKEE